MKKSVFGRQFKRDTGERTALFKALMTSLVLEERIKTTEAKAKSIKSAFDKIITRAKKGEKARNILQRSIYKEALDKLIKDIGPRFEKRQGGYTRIIRLGERLSDKAQMVLMELTELSKQIVPAKTDKAIKDVVKEEKLDTKPNKKTVKIKEEKLKTNKTVKK